jgi:uncharacterized protein YciI
VFYIGRVAVEVLGEVVDTEDKLVAYLQGHPDVLKEYRADGTLYFVSDVVDKVGDYKLDYPGLTGCLQEATEK